jgi:hypothetical protein
MDRQRRIELFLLAAHRLAMSRLREEPQRVGELRAVLHRWRAQNGPSRSDSYLDRWERLLDMPLDDLEIVICAEDEEATVLRSTSPIAPLITPQEREQLLADARRL